LFTPFFAHTLHPTPSPVGQMRDLLLRPWLPDSPLPREGEAQGETREGSDASVCRGAVGVLLADVHSASAARRGAARMALAWLAHPQDDAAKVT